MLGELTSRTTPIRAILIFLSSAIGLIVAFEPSLTTNVLLPNADPLFFYASFKAAQHFGSLFDLQTFAFGQGFGGFQHPTILNPYWWVLDWTHSVVLSYYFTIAALFLSTSIYFYALGRNIYFGIIAGTAACSVFFNLNFIVDFFGPVAPQAIVQMGFAYFGLAILMASRVSFLRMLAGLFLSGLAVIMDWQYAVFVVSLIAINVTVCAFYLNGARRIQLLATVLFGIGLFYAAGFYDAYDGYTIMSKRLWGPSMQDNLPTSLLIFGGWPGLAFSKTFGILAAIGTCYCIFVWRGRVSLLATLTALYVAVLALVDLDAAGPHVYWNLPTVSYFERPLIPLYVIFLTYAVRDILTKAYGFVRGRVDRIPRIRRLAIGSANALPGSTFHTIVPIFFAVAVVLVLVIRVPASWNWNNHIPSPARWDTTEAFVKELGIPPAQGHDFSPYFFDTTTGNAFYNCISLGKWEWFGRYCGHMMNIFSSRTFVEFHNLEDIQNYPMYAQASQFSSDPIDTPQGPHGTLKSFGVRYVAVNGEMEGAKHFVLGDRKVSLFDLGPIGAADLSVKSVKYDETYNGQEVLLARRANEAVVHDRAAADLLSTLVPVESVKFEYQPDRFVISAESSGNSLLLLPFQFSNCLSISDPQDGMGLVRVNGAQAALRFNTHARISILNNFRMFGDRTCRRRDFRDVFRIGLWPRPTYEQITDGRRVPTVMRLILQSRIRQRDAIEADSTK